MSDPVTNVEIEDVLSSIRRLVSESGGAQAEPKRPTAAPVMSKPAPAPEPALEADPLDKLVLTPSLRVADAPEAKPDEAEAESVAQNEPPAQESAAETHESPEAESPEAEAAAEADPVPEHGAAEDAPAEPEPQAESESLKDWIQLLETAVSAQEGEWEEEDTIKAHVWEDHSTDAAVPAEPFAAEESFGNEGEATATSDQDADGFDFMGGDEALLDEDTLREMVSEIVRQELQGALGERITRNVRKLVRREIHRALLAQEFE